CSMTCGGRPRSSRARCTTSFATPLDRGLSRRRHCAQDSSSEGCDGPEFSAQRLGGIMIAKLSTLLFATMSLAFTSYDALADELEDLIQGGVVKVAVPSDFPPFGSLGKDGKLEGYDIDVARLLARDLGVKLELVPVTSVNRIPYLLNCKTHLVVATLGATPERAKVIAFTDAY